MIAPNYQLQIVAIVWTQVKIICMAQLFPTRLFMVLLPISSAIRSSIGPWLQHLAIGQQAYS